MLRKEYFDCPQRDSHAVHYIEKGGGGEVESVHSCTLYSLATVTSYTDASVRIVTKSSRLGPLLVFSISLNIATRFMEQIVHLILFASSDNVSGADFMRYFKLRRLICDLS